MTNARCEQLKDEAVLTLGIRRCAWKYFGRTDNADDAEAGAWEKILKSPGDLEQIDYLTIARRSISAAYMRQWRKRKPLSRRKA
jgi:hypothetical protein